MEHPRTSPLLTAPEEIRQCIYTYLFSPSHPIRLQLNSPPETTHFEPAIARIRAIRAGALEAFYSAAICCV